MEGRIHTGSLKDSGQHSAMLVGNRIIISYWIIAVAARIVPVLFTCWTSRRHVVEGRTTNGLLELRLRADNQEECRGYWNTARYHIIILIAFLTGMLMGA